MSIWVAIFFWASTIFYALGVAGLIWAEVFKRPNTTKIAMRLAWFGFALHTITVILRWTETGHIPTIGNFENTLFGGWFIAAMALWAGHRQRYPLLAAGVLPFALIIMGGGAMSDTAARPMVASLRSFWLFIHIFFAWLAYGGYTVACGAGVIYLSKSRKGRETPKEELGRLDELMFRSTVFGFITDTLMIAAGSIWAKDLWGSYWSWDPVETWSLLSWLVYGVSIHLRVTLGWRGRRLAWLLVVAIVFVLISFWGVNMVMEGTYHVFTVDEAMG